MGAFESGGSAPVAGACTLTTSTAAYPATFNVSSPAHADWFAPAGAGNLTAGNYRGIGGTHTKLRGPGTIYTTFEWVMSGLTGIQGQASGMTVTAAANDDLGGGLSSSTDTIVLTTSTTAIGWGWRIQAPAGTKSRTLVVYSRHFSCDVQVTVTALDGSFVAQTATDVQGAGAFNPFVSTIVYNTASPGQQIMVDLLVTSNHGATPNVGFTLAVLD